MTIPKALRRHERPSVTHISIPGLVTGGFLDALTEAGQAPPSGSFDLPTKTVTANGTRLHYFEFGEGPPVVFVHGSLGDYRIWGSQFEAFSLGFRVVSYSRRYHYPNTWSGDGSDYTTGLHTEDLAAFVEALGLGPVNLVGQSTGATIAARCASRYPGLVRTLVVNEPDHAPWLLDSEAGRSAWDEYAERVDGPVTKLARDGAMERAIERFVDGVLGDGTFRSFPPSMRSVCLDNARELAAEIACAETFYSAFTDEDMTRIDSPALLVEGGASLPLFRVIADRFARGVPHLERVTVPGATHAVHFSAPEAFAGAVLGFLHRHETARR